MNAPIFVDTNILVYAHQPNEPLKRTVAIQWVERLWQEQLGPRVAQLEPATDGFGAVGASTGSRATLPTELVGQPDCGSCAVAELRAFVD